LHKYDKLMEKVKVTEDMRKRIINNINKEEIAESKRNRRFIHYRKYMYIAACFVALFMGVFAASNILKHEQMPDEMGILNISGILEMTSAEELSKSVGFEISDIQSLMLAAAKSEYLFFGQGLAEISYEFEKQTVTFRKSTGTEDNSGNYTNYKTVKKVTINSYDVTLKGTGEEYCLAVWTDGKFSYSLHFKNAVSVYDIENIIMEIK